MRDAVRVEGGEVEHDHELTPSCVHGTFAFLEIRRTVLNPGTLSFVVANAPLPVVHSFELRRQRLASLSLRVASGMLLRRLRKTGGEDFNSPFFQVFHPLASRTKSALLLAACALGRLGLGTLAVLRHGTPQRLHLWVSANILRNVGNLLTDTELLDQPESAVIKTSKTINERAVQEVGPPLFDRSDVTADILRALTVSLPTDLSRLIFLATLRDNNSGRYYHPEVARRFSDSLADQAMLACHQRIYRRVVALPVEDLTDELDRYIATVPVPRERMIESWKKLKAYRATIPIDADPVSAEIFFMKVEVAVAILESRVPGQVF